MGINSSRKIKSPFRDDNKPSCKIYVEDELDKLWDFSQRRSYFSYHYIKMVLNKDPLKYLLKNGSIEEINYYSKQFDELKEEKDNNFIEIENVLELDELYNSIDSRIEYNWLYD